MGLDCDVAGYQKLLEACHSSKLRKKLLPNILLEDQDWVVLTESWPRFSAEERMDWLNKLIKTMWPHINIITLKVRGKVGPSLPRPTPCRCCR
eukprot:703535-Prorocentrum_minimum.AAC.3